MKINKLLTLLMLVQLSFATWTLTKSAHAQTSKPLLKVEPDSYFAYKKGEVFKVNVTINFVEVSSRLVFIGFRMSYDANLLEVLNVTEGPFLSQFNNTVDPPYTFFVSFVEANGMYGPHVLVGTMIFPNATGYWNVFPEGNGTVATITFKAIYQPIEPNPPANCTFNFMDVQLLNDNVEEISFETESGYYEIPPALYPTALFSFDPVYPSMGEVIIFNGTASRDPDGIIVSYYWDFGDGTSIITIEPIIYHIYSQQGTFNVTLIVTDIDGLSANITKTISVGYYEELILSIDVGSMYFAGELADFYILASHFGKPIDVTSMEVLLYYNGSLLVDLTNDVQHISKGMYRVVYQIPAYAETGTYTVMSEAEYYSVKGTAIKSFLVSSTLSDFLRVINATLINIKETTAIINSTLGTLTIDVASINATLVGLNGTVAYINSTVGALAVPIQNINLTVTEIKRDMATGQGIAVIQTSLGTIQGKVVAIEGNVTKIATIETDLGSVKADVSSLLDSTSDISRSQGTLTTLIYVAILLALIAAVAAIIIFVKIRKT